MCTLVTCFYTVAFAPSSCLLGHKINMFQDYQGLVRVFLLSIILSILDTQKWKGLCYFPGHSSGSVIKWWSYNTGTRLHCWPFVTGSHRSPVDSPQKGSVIFSFLWCQSEPAVEQIVELPVIFDTMTLKWRHCNTANVIILLQIET